MINNIKIGKIKLCDYIIAALLTFAVLFIVFHLWEVNIWEVPFSYSVDGLTNLVFTKCMIEEGGFGYTSERLGAPFGYASYDASQSDYLSSLLKKLVSVFSENTIFVVNFSYLLGFIIITCISLAVLKSLDLENKTAIVFAVLYACTPYHFGRGTAHFSLAFYAAVPIAVFYILKMIQGYYLKQQGYQGWIKYILAMTVIGISGVYYAFFSCFFFSVAVVYVLINEKSIKRIKEMAVSIILITTIVIIGYLPTIFYWIANGKNENGIVRYSGEIELYALKISQLIMPITGHRISWLAQLKNKYNQNYIVNENDICSLGFIFSAGFIILLLHLWKKKRYGKDRYLDGLACLNLAAILYAATGGFMNIQGIFFSMIRCGNRISIFIAFFSCICAGIFVSDYVKKSRLSGKVSVVLLVCLLTAGIFDNTRSAYIDAESTYAAVENDREFIEQIEDTESGEGMILQLPVMQYPESGGVVHMPDYAHLIGYMYSDNLCWSYGTFRGRAGSGLLDVFQSEQMSAAKMTLLAAKMGYAGIYIDRLGYEEEDYEYLLAELQKVLQSEPIKSSDENKVYFSLKDYTAQNKPKDDYCSIEFGNGIYGQESNEDKQWRWVSQESRFRIYNWSSNKQKVHCMLQIEPTWEGDHTLTIKGEEEYVFNLKPHQVNNCSIELELSPGFHLFEIYTDAPLLDVPGDQRELCYMLTDYKVESLDNGYE